VNPFSLPRRILARDPETGELRVEQRFRRARPPKRYGPRATYYPTFRPTEKRPHARLVLRVGRDERTYTDGGRGHRLIASRRVV